MNVGGTDMYLTSEARRAAGRETTERLQYKDILFREMQHRVANSLQIIANIPHAQGPDHAVGGEPIASPGRVPSNPVGGDRAAAPPGLGDTVN